MAPNHACTGTCKSVHDFRLPCSKGTHVSSLARSSNSCTVRWRADLCRQDLCSTSIILCYHQCCIPVDQPELGIRIPTPCRHWYTQPQRESAARHHRLPVEATTTKTTVVAVSSTVPFPIGPLRAQGGRMLPWRPYRVKQHPPDRGWAEYEGPR